MTNLNTPSESPEDKYPIGSMLDYTFEDGNKIDVRVMGYDGDFIVLQEVIDDLPIGEEIKITPKILDLKSEGPKPEPEEEKPALRQLRPEEMNLKYPIDSEVIVRRNEYDDRGKKTGEKYAMKGVIHSFEKDINRYVVRVPQEYGWEDVFITVSERALNELNDKKIEIDNTRTTLRDAFGNTNLPIA